MYLGKKNTAVKFIFFPSSYLDFQILIPVNLKIKNSGLTVGFLANVELFIGPDSLYCGNGEKLLKASLQ